VRCWLGHSGWMLQVPATLAERASQDLGAEGRRWIGHLPEIVTAAQRHWSLTLKSVLPPGKELSVLVAVTTAAGHPAVLKVSYPDAQPLHEAAALSRWAGHGAAALLRAHPYRGLLLEQLASDRSLGAVDDAAALPIAARMLRQLWVPFGHQHSFPEHAARVQGPVLLHGDFHRGNVLASARAGWLAIDPCPLAGDPEFDIADLAADLADEQIGQPAAGSKLATVLSDLCQAIPHLDSQRVHHWMLAKRIILALDNLAAAGSGEWDLTFARLLLNLPGQQPGRSRESRLLAGQQPT
jgi:streptomycin 6-kinase